MKKLLILLVSATISFGAFAQRKGYYHTPHYYRPRTHVYISPFSYGFGFGYPYFGYPYYASPYIYDYPFYEGRRVPYKLSLEIQSIKLDYRSKIREARKDKSVSRSQRRKEIRALKTERDQDIFNAQRNLRRRPAKQ